MSGKTIHGLFVALTISYCDGLIREVGKTAQESTATVQPKSVRQRWLEYIVRLQEISIGNSNVKWRNIRHDTKSA